MRMIIKNEFTFPSRNETDKIHAYSWAPKDGNIRGIFQIIHGMQEYVERYEEFAIFLAKNGFLVVGEDHLGHGRTAATDKDLGYFTPHAADTILVRDSHRLKKIIEEKHPGVPYFIMGHSMGSFILRKYLAMYGKGISGAIIAGTGCEPAFLTGSAIFLTRMLKLFRGDRYHSRFITKLAFGTYLKKIPNPKTASDWLTRDDEVVKKYRRDKFCTFKFSVNGYRALFKLIRYVCNPGNLTKISKDMPILVTSGMEDPVGNYGKDPVKVYEQYKNLGIKDVTLKLYKDCRHEIISELNKEEIHIDILNWVNAHIN